MPAFDAQNLADLSGICLHLSIWAAIVRSSHQSFRTERLTVRELQIVELVTLGRTNAEIGTRTLDYGKFCQASLKANVPQTRCIISRRNGGTAFGTTIPSTY